MCVRASVKVTVEIQMMNIPSIQHTSVHTVTGGANDRHSGCGVRPRRGFYSTEIIK